MDLQNKLPQFTQLDVEFSKNCRQVYDILMSSFNKRIKLIEACSDDLTEWLAKSLIGNKEWEIFQKPELDLMYPKIKDDGFTKFGLNSEWNDFGFFMTIDLQKKQNANSGIKIEVAFGLDEINWYIGQFGNFERGDEYFNYSFYKNVKGKFPKHPLYGVSIAFPNKPGVEDGDGDKWIKISVNFEDLDRKTSQDLIIKIQKAIKAKILNPMISTLKRNSI